MWSLTCVPVNVYKALYKFTPVFRWVQGGAFLGLLLGVDRPDSR
jgi:hypothetical protein